eukprot:9479067-Pyramimonas_sp.AAC.1
MKRLNKVLTVDSSVTRRLDKVLTVKSTVIRRLTKVELAGFWCAGSGAHGVLLPRPREGPHPPVPPQTLRGARPAAVRVRGVRGPDRRKAQRPLPGRMPAGGTPAPAFGKLQTNIFPRRNT